MHRASGGFREGYIGLLDMEHVRVGRCLLVLRPSHVLCIASLVVGVRGDLDQILYA